MFIIILNELLKSMPSLNISGMVLVKPVIIKGNVMSILYDIVYELMENIKGKSVMIYVFNNNGIKLKAIIETKLKIKQHIKLDNVKIKETIYDSDTELLFSIKGGEG